ncbi:hypothetical protein J2S08_001367 [Bacillus chungangensis]|uniref:Uncharacterized protein n=1 Tax=Bacillus chungangensis TaxID=587633 RepID=A0ABT9WQW5_9BACI|nr:hypothetical protein [Bacillus chungangensis]
MKNHLRLSGTTSSTHAKPIIGKAILCMGRNM